MKGINVSHATIKSRLGSLLIKKGLITEQQLDVALKLQLTSGLRLGEALIDLGVLTERQLHKALKKQSRHRFIATIMAMILGPMSFGAFAGQSNASSQQNHTNSSSHLDQYSGLQALDDEGLADIAGQGFNTPQQTFENLLASAQGESIEHETALSELGPLSDVMNALNPLASMFDSDVTIKGVKYNANTPRSRIKEDGSIEFSLPSEIEEIAFKNMRVKGANPQHSLGDVVISNIRFSDQSRISIRIRE
jgi:hypothetical protein